MNLSTTISLVSTSNFNYTTSAPVHIPNTTAPAHKQINNFQIINNSTAILLLITSIIGIIGNFSTILVIFKSSNLRTVTYVYLANLALADLILSLAMPLWAGMYYNNMFWPGIFLKLEKSTGLPIGSVTCKTARFLTKQNMFASVGILTGLSIDRALAVVSPSAKAGRSRSVNMKSSLYGAAHGRNNFFKYFISNNYVLMSMLIIWVISIFFALPELFWSTIHTVEINPEENIFKGYCTFAIPAENKEDYAFRMGIYETFMLLVSFLIPIAVLTVCYSLIIVTVNSRMIGKSDKKRRAIVLAARVVIIFFLCYAPQQGLKAYSIIYGWFKLLNYEMTPWEKKIYHNLYTPAVILVFMNSAINPFIYGFGVDEFKKSFYRVFSMNRMEARMSIGSRRISQQRGSGYHITTGEDQSCNARLSKFSIGVDPASASRNPSTLSVNYITNTTKATDHDSRTRTRTHLDSTNSETVLLSNRKSLGIASRVSNFFSAKNSSKKGIRLEVSNGVDTCYTDVEGSSSDPTSV